MFTSIWVPFIFLCYPYRARGLLSSGQTSSIHQISTGECETYPPLDWADQLTRRDVKIVTIPSSRTSKEVSHFFISSILRFSTHDNFPLEVIWLKIFFYARWRPIKSGEHEIPNQNRFLYYWPCIFLGFYRLCGLGLCTVFDRLQKQNGGTSADVGIYWTVSSIGTIKCFPRNATD